MTDQAISTPPPQSDDAPMSPAALPSSAFIQAKTDTSVRQVILEQITSVARQQARRLAPLTDDLRLLDTGLDSLCLAILVAKLDDELGLDPLSDSSHAFPITVGDFIRLYERAAV